MTWSCPVAEDCAPLGLWMPPFTFCPGMMLGRAFFSVLAAVDSHQRPSFLGFLGVLHEPRLQEAGAWAVSWTEQVDESTSHLPAPPSLPRLPQPVEPSGVAKQQRPPRVAAFGTAACWTVAWQRSCLDGPYVCARRRLLRVQEGLPCDHFGQSVRACITA